MSTATNVNCPNCDAELHVVQDGEDVHVTAADASAEGEAGDEGTDAET